MKINEIITEIDIGGGVDSDFLDYNKSAHDYDSDQLDLFPKKIPTLDPKLPDYMKIVGKIDSYRVVERGTKPGEETDDDIHYLLFDKSKPIAWIALQDPDREHDISDELRGKGMKVGSVFIDPPYRGSNLGLKLYRWCLMNVCDYIVADILQTKGGVNLWKKLLTSKQFHVEVFDFRKYTSRRRRPGKDFNQVYNTTGILVPWVTLAGKEGNITRDLDD
jgi:hypothetical protein